MGAPEEAERVDDRSREGPADVAEELGLEEIRRNRAAVHRHERTLGSDGQAVDRRGDQLLARSARTLDEDGRVGDRDLGDDVLDTLHGRRGADQLVEGQFLAQAHAEGVHLAPEEAALNHAPHDVLELVKDQGLGEIVVGAFLEGLHRRGDRGIARHHDDLDRFVLSLDLAEKLEAVHVGHSDVGDGGVEEFGSNRGQGLGPRGGARHPVTEVREGFLEDPEDARFVIDHEDIAGFHELRL